MYKFYYLLIIFISSQTLKAQYEKDWKNAPVNPIPFEYTLNHFNLISDVKSKEDFDYTTSVLFSRQLFEFDLKGLLIKKTLIDSKNLSKSSYYIYTYNKDNTLVKMDYYNQNELNVTTTFVYDSKKQLIETSQKNITNPNLNSKKVYKYFSNGLFKESIYYGINNLESKIIYEYDNDNRLVSDAMYTNQKLTYKNSYTYKINNENLLEVITNNFYEQIGAIKASSSTTTIKYKEGISQSEKKCISI